MLALAVTVFLVAMCAAIAYLMLSVPEDAPPEDVRNTRETETPAPHVPETAPEEPAPQEPAPTPIAPPREDVTPESPNTASVSGTVINEMTGEPLDDFEVAILPGSGAMQTPVYGGGQGTRTIEPGQDFAVPGTSDWVAFWNAQGAFRFDNVPTGTPLHLLARSEGFVTSWVDINVDAGRTVDDVNLRLRRGCSVEGSVTDSAGAPIEGAMVAFVYPSKEAFSDAGGHFLLHDLPEQEGSVLVTHPEFIPAEVEATPTTRTVIRTDVVLLRPGTLEGVVRRGTEPLAGCEVDLSSVDSIPLGTEPGETTTDEDGRYQLTKQAPGEAWLRIRPVSSYEEYSSIRRRVSLEEGAVTIVDFDLPAMDAVVEGTVLLDGLPPEQGIAHLRIDNLIQQTSTYATLSPDGGYRLEGPWSGAAVLRVSLMLPSGDRLEPPREALHIREGDVIRQDFNLSAPAAIHGTVSGARESEVVSVALSDAAQGMPALESMDDITALADAFVQATLVQPDGTFKIESVAAGDYLLLVVAVESDPDAVTAGGGGSVRQASETIALTPGGEMEVNLHLE